MWGLIEMSKIKLDIQELIIDCKSQKLEFDKLLITQIPELEKAMEMIRNSDEEVTKEQFIGITEALSETTKLHTQGMINHYEAFIERLETILKGDNNE